MKANTAFLTDTLNQVLPFPRKKSNGGINVNCPMCLSRGEPRPDTKFRCGVRMFATGGIHIHCFNCGFVTKWAPGARLTKNVGLFLKQLGMGDRELQKLKFTAWQISQSVDDAERQQFVAPSFVPKFDEIAMPEGALPISQWVEYELDDPDFLAVCEYAFTRGDDVFNSANLHWSPSTEHGMNRRLLVPFYWQGKIVGWTGRAIDKGVIPKYYTNTPAHFLFNSAALDKDRRFAIVVEGQFDALAIDGVSTQGAKLSHEQAYWLKESGKQIIVLPDQDESGQALIDLALQHEWMVSFPGWDADVKDANEAVIKYGRLYTVRSIIDGATNNKLKINLSRKKLGR